MEAKLGIEMKTEVKIYIQKVLILTLGNIVAALGVSLCALAGKGVDPLTVLYQGVCNVTGFEIGLAALSVNIFLLLICLVLDRTSIKSGTIISMVTFSMFLNFFFAHVGTVLSGRAPFLLWIYLMLGIVLMGVGFSTAIFAGVGPNCLDVVLGIVMDKTRFSMKICKSMVDFVSVALGVILGASFGMGTIFCVLLVGVIYAWNTSLLDRL